MDLSANPWMLALNAIALLFVLFHAVTWFNRRRRRWSSACAAGACRRHVILPLHYAAWVLLPALAAWLVLD